MPDNVFSTVDRMGQRSTMRFRGGSTAADIQAVADALDAIIRGSPIKASFSTDTIVDVGDATPPADNEADRNNKWLLRIQTQDADSQPTVLTHEIGTADNTHLPSSNSDFLDLTAGVGLALKTAIDAAYVGPYDSGGVLLSVQQVTRKG